MALAPLGDGEQARGNERDQRRAECPPERVAEGAREWGGDVGADPVDDGLRRGTRREDFRDTDACQLGNVRVGDDPATENDHVRRTAFGQQLDDAASAKVCREIARSIQRQLTYPGEVKVTVLRETRSVEFAR